MILGLRKLTNIPVVLRSSEFTAIKSSQNKQTKKKKRKNSGKNIMIKSNYIASWSMIY